MKTLVLIFAILISSPAWATSYFLSASGSDSNNGLSSGAPWLSPNHALNCGDTITAAASTSYSAANFGNTSWGTVTCPSGNNVAWLQCATFDACKISVTSGTLDGMNVSASYWGIQGWEVDNTAGGTGGGNCFTIFPPGSLANIHHIIFADNIANTCPLDGFSSANRAQAGVDYIAYIGNISYAAAQANTFCGSGFSVYQPVAHDSVAGTHIYLAGNFSISTGDPSGCYDGNGFILDTFDGDQLPLTQSYPQQAAMENNISVSNAGKGILIENNKFSPGPPFATLYARNNTTWNNDIASVEIGSTPCGEITIYNTTSTFLLANIASTVSNTCYGGAPTNYAFTAQGVDGTSTVFGANVGWDSAGNYSLITSSPGFSFGPQNYFGTNPSFASPTTPGAPSCGSASSTVNCMATVIANFTPGTTAVKTYGYQAPSTTAVYNPLYPAWLCNVTLPTGLVTPGCLIGGSTASGVTIK